MKLWNRTIATSDSGSVPVDVLSGVYVALLLHPHDRWRIFNQEVYCNLRDAIADATGRTDEEVQTIYESLAEQIRATHTGIV